MATKSRQELKSFFVKNAIPTEGNFADLIDSPLNQSDDGVFKRPGEPLAVVAAPGEERRALRLYADYPASTADWYLQMRAYDAGSASNRAGLCVADSAGTPRLFLDAATGNLGVGTTDVPERLTVAGGIRATGDVTADGTVHATRAAVGVAPTGQVFEVGVGGGRAGWDRFVVSAEPGWGDAGYNYVTIGAGGAAGLMLNNPHVSWQGDDGWSGARASVRYGRTGGVPGGTYWDAGVRPDGAFAFASHDDGGAGGDVVRIDKAGRLAAQGYNLKIYTINVLVTRLFGTTSGAALVDLDARIPGFNATVVEVLSAYATLSGVSQYQQSFDPARPTDTSFATFSTDPSVTHLPQHFSVKAESPRFTAGRWQLLVTGLMSTSGTSADTSTSLWATLVLFCRTR